MEKCQKDLLETLETKNIFFQVFKNENNLKVETKDNLSHFSKFEIKRIDPKSPFSINSNTANFGLGTAYGEILAQNLSDFFYYKYANYCSVKRKLNWSKVEELVTNINQSIRENEKYVIISFNLQLEKSILANNKDFISVEIQGKRESSLYVGTYRKCPMYAVYQGGFPSAILILNLKSIGNFKVLIGDNPENLKKIGDYIYFSIKDFGDPANQDLLSEYLDMFSKDANQLNEHYTKGDLKKMVEIRMELFYEYEEPKTDIFDGALFVVQYD